MKMKAQCAFEDEQKIKKNLRLKLLCSHGDGKTHEAYVDVSQLI